MKRICLAALLCFASLAEASHAQEREWVLDVAESDAFLVFGVPNTGDVGVSLWCKLGSGSMQMFSPLPAGTPPTDTTIDVNIAVSGKQDQRKASVVVESGRSSFEFKLTPDDPLLDQLASTDHFAITVAKHTTTYPMTGADVPAFQKLCTFSEDAPSN